MENNKLMEKRVFMSNPLFEAKRRMSIFGEKIFKIGLANIRPHIKDEQEGEYDTEFHEVIIPYNKLIEYFGYDASTLIKNAVEDNVNETIKSYLQRKTEDGWDDAVPLYAYIGYKKNVGLRFKFNSEWKKDLIELVRQTNFSSYKLKEIFNLSLVHSVRLMELMQMKAGHFKDHDEIYADYSIDFLKNVLTKGGYEGRNDNFRRIVINQAVNEINAKTRYELKYENIKEGRKVIGYKFIMKFKEGYNDNDTKIDENKVIDVKIEEEMDQEKQKAYTALLNAGINSPVAKKLLEIEEPKYIIKDVEKGIKENAGPGAIVNNIKAGNAREMEKKEKEKSKKIEERTRLHHEIMWEEARKPLEEDITSESKEEKDWSLDITKYPEEIQETLRKLEKNY
ncbi:MAG: replication initiation protein [Treponema sp.]|nr:replication initiation protein [Treponema sp.]